MPVLLSLRRGLARLPSGWNYGQRAYAFGAGAAERDLQAHRQGEDFLRRSPGRLVAGCRLGGQCRLSRGVVITSGRDEVRGLPGSLALRCRAWLALTITTPAGCILPAAQLHPLRYVNGLADAAKRHGARLYCGFSALPESGLEQGSMDRLRLRRAESWPARCCWQLIRSHDRLGRICTRWFCPYGAFRSHWPRRPLRRHRRAASSVSDMRSIISYFPFGSGRVGSSSAARGCCAGRAAPRGLRGAAQDPAPPPPRCGP